MNNETQTTDFSPSPDLLSESDISFEYATTGQRFLNWLIDNIIIRLTLNIGIMVLLILFLEPVAPEFVSRMGVLGTFEYFVLVVFLLAVNYIIYYTLFEKFVNGQTIGKLITGTKAVRLDGSPLTFRDALLRSLSRAVPFEVFSGFGVPWHDSWTDTTVIKKR